jgi:hypothetical protein
MVADLLAVHEAGEFFPPDSGCSISARFVRRPVAKGTVRAVLAHQQENGAWDVAGGKLDRRYGTSYTAGLVIFWLGAPNAFLPIFER